MEDEDNQSNKNYYKLPYLGIISKQTKKKLRKLGKELCKGIDITLCFSVCKIGSFLPLKSKNLPTLKSFVVYKYICAGCGGSYVGQTTRHWLVRIREHLKTDKTRIYFNTLIKI